MIYAMLIFKHSDWLFKFFNQSECWKNKHSVILHKKLFIGLALDGGDVINKF